MTSIHIMFLVFLSIPIIMVVFAIPGALIHPLQAAWFGLTCLIKK